MAVAGKRELGSFGSLIAYLAALERDVGAFYGKLSANRGGEPFSRLCGVYQKRARLLERIGRENVNEMILEKIEGLEEIGYQECLDDRGSREELVARLKGLEERIAGFYADAAEKGKAVLAEVEKKFKKLAEGNREHKTWLEA